MYFARRSFLAMVLIGLLLVSCGAPAAPQATPDINGTIAAAAQTLANSLFQTQTALAPVATNTPLPSATSLPTTTALALPSPLPFATATQAYVYVYPTATPTGTWYTATPNGSTLAYGCNNLGLRNQDIADGTTYKPGETFTQSWKVVNTGTCNWGYTYQVVFVSGSKMDGGGIGRWDKPTAPGDWTHIDISFTAPNDPGTYTGYWRMTDAAGHAFGASLGISIVVPSPTKTPKFTDTPVPTPISPAEMTATKVCDALKTLGTPCP